MDAVKALNCSNCGAPLTVRAGEHSLTVVCERCLSVLDARDPSLKVLQTFEERQRVAPLIPLGTRGKLRGDLYEVIGFQVREIEVDSIPYEWREYLLFNPFKGFRYLTEYDGHWNDVKPLKSIPEQTKARGRAAVKLLGETYTEFQTASAKTVFVLGEFPWQFRVGEAVYVKDYISPPRMLSAEITEQEITWSLGEYITGDEIWKSFQLPGHPPAAKGIYANQPSPYQGSTKSAWAYCLALLVALFALMFVFSVAMRQEEVFRAAYRYTQPSRGEASFVTPSFELQGRPSNVELSIRTDLENNWAYFSFALINETNGAAIDFGREVSYYHGRDSDGSWSEGSPEDSVLIPTVPAGKYYLRVEPEMESGAAHSMRYSLRMRRDVPQNLFFWLAALLLLIPPVLATFRASGFEKARWAESTLAPAGGSGDD